METHSFNVKARWAILKDGCLNTAFGATYSLPPELAQMSSNTEHMAAY